MDDIKRRLAKAVFDGLRIDDLAVRDLAGLGVQEVVGWTEGDFALLLRVRTDKGPRVYEIRVREVR